MCPSKTAMCARRQVSRRFRHLPILPTAATIGSHSSRRRGHAVLLHAPGWPVSSYAVAVGAKSLETSLMSIHPTRRSLTPLPPSSLATSTRSNGSSGRSDCKTPVAHSPSLQLLTAPLPPEPWARIPASTFPRAVQSPATGVRWHPSSQAPGPPLAQAKRATLAEATKSKPAPGASGGVHGAGGAGGGGELAAAGRGALHGWPRFLAGQSARPNRSSVSRQNRPSKMATS
jgi:hypothetical protein